MVGELEIPLSKIGKCSCSYGTTVGRQAGKFCAHDMSVNSMLATIDSPPLESVMMVDRRQPRRSLR